jgi:hypothetical protein
VTRLGNIRDVDDYVGKLWAFTMFKDCFPGTGRKPSDIDGIVDGAGHILVMEGKHHLDHGLDGGQAPLFRNLRKPKSITSLIWWGEPPDGPIIRMRYDPPVLLDGRQNGAVGQVCSASLGDLQDAVREWHRWVEDRRRC